jgi:FHS family Na+ dependent glucose MFS transporter 1
MAFIGLGLVGAVLGPTLPYLAKLTQSSISQISLLFVARSLGYLMSSVLGGYLFDRLSGHPLMAITLVGLGISLLLTPFVSLLWVLITILFLTGISQGIIDVGGNTLIVWLHGKNVGPYLNALHMFYGVGTFLAPVIIAQAVLISGSINWGYWVIAAFVILPALQLFSLPSQPIPTKKPGINAAQSKGFLVFLAALFIFCYSSFANIFGGWIFSYVVRLGLTSEANAAYITSMFWGAFTVGRLISIPVATRFRPNSILLGDLVGCLLSTGIILKWPTSIEAIWIGAAGLGLSAASLFPTTVTLVEGRMQITGSVTSRFVIGSALGAMITPWIVGQFFEVTGPQMVIYSVFITIAAGLGVFFFLRRETKRS